ncbi:hypothetical protein HK104_007004 [Borealophlyctis nickersoniae]|nr:hypothetical protein HK104_007004 [Borealophlyctis nickersoniae]
MDSPQPSPVSLSEGEDDKDPLSTDKPSDSNAMLIQNLDEIEKFVSLVLKHAGSSLQQLAKGAETEDEAAGDEDRFEQMEDMFANLSAIQDNIGEIFGTMSSLGILSTAGASIPYNANVAGEEKDLDASARCVALVLAKLRRSLAVEVGV